MLICLDPDHYEGQNYTDTNEHLMINKSTLKSQQVYGKLMLNLMLKSLLTYQ